MSLFPIEASSPHAVSDAPDATLVASMWSNDWHILTVTVRTTVSGLPTGEVAGGIHLLHTEYYGLIRRKRIARDTCSDKASNTNSEPSTFHDYLQGMNPIYPN